jgi:hypothetical protein
VTPTMNVIDANGVIRHPRLGVSNGAAVGAAIHEWIAKAKKKEMHSSVAALVTRGFPLGHRAARR